MDKYRTGDIHPILSYFLIEKRKSLARLDFKINIPDHKRIATSYTARTLHKSSEKDYIKEWADYLSDPSYFKAVPIIHRINKGNEIVKNANYLEHLKRIQEFQSKNKSNELQTKNNPDSGSKRSEELKVDSSTTRVEPAVRYTPNAISFRRGTAAIRSSQRISAACSTSSS